MVEKRALKTVVLMVDERVELTAAVMAVRLALTKDKMLVETRAY